MSGILVEGLVEARKRASWRLPWRKQWVSTSARGMPWSSQVCMRGTLNEARCCCSRWRVSCCSFKHHMAVFEFLLCLIRNRQFYLMDMNILCLGSIYRPYIKYRINQEEANTREKGLGKAKLLLYCESCFIIVFVELLMK